MADAGAGDAAGPPPRRPPGPAPLPGAALQARPAAGAPAPCAKCGRPAPRPRDCEHTGWEAYCTECYVELHYYLTEPAGADGS